MMVRTQKGKLLIIVGAGISLDAPTLAPSPFRVIKAALSPMLSIPATPLAPAAPRIGLRGRRLAFLGFG